MLGFVICVPQKYEEQAIKCIQRLRSKFQLENPVEIWEAGLEITDDSRKELQNLGNIIFRNVSEYTDNLNHWMGYQIKAFAAYHTSFEEFVLCDSDIMFCQNPLIILNDENYKKTGAYFFRDLYWKFKSNNSKHYLSCKAWLRDLFPSVPANFPKEWSHFLDTSLDGKEIKGLCKEYMEAGVMYFNRSKMNQVLEEVYKLNDNHKEVYSYIHGDKDTWWIACCLTNTNFTMNKKIPLFIPPLTHFYKNKAFFYQKEINIWETFYYWLKTPIRIFKYSRTI